MTELTSENIEAGKNYKWKCSDQKLIYIGKAGNWHQFKWVDDPKRRDVWCEVLDEDLHMIEAYDNEHQRTN